MAGVGGVAEPERVAIVHSCVTQESAARTRLVFLQTPESIAGDSGRRLHPAFSILPVADIHERQIGKIGEQ